ncbi:E3 ubiquitin-protein ligase Siah1-like [Amblyomma americanum]
MDRLAREVFPCKFSLKGCAALLSYIDKPEHEQACEFRPYVCPFPGGSCKWQGSLDQVTSHLVHWHESPICEATTTCAPVKGAQRLGALPSSVSEPPPPPPKLPSTDK